MNTDTRFGFTANQGRILLGFVFFLAPVAAGWAAGNAWVRILDFAALYVMLALGLNIVVGFAGLLDLGYIAFYAVGAYLYAFLASPHFGLHLPPLLILPLCALAAGLFGILLGAPTLRLRGDYLAIVTLGFGEIIRIFLNNLDIPINITNGPKGIATIDPLSIGGHELIQGFTFAVPRLSQLGTWTIPGLYCIYYLFGALALLIVFVSRRLEKSRLGRAWIAIREDELAAKACGINTRNLKILAFALGASFGGLAGGLFAGFQNFVSPESFVLTESIMVLCMVTIGGMGSITGVILGSLLLAILPEILRAAAVPVQMMLLGRIVLAPEALRMLLFGSALILVMIYRPAGLWPDAQPRRGR